MGSYALPAPIFIMPYMATDRVPVAQLPTYVKIQAPPHLPTYQDAKHHNKCYPT
jgi:hypothetical protein